MGSGNEAKRETASSGASIGQQSLWGNQAGIVTVKDSHMTQQSIQMQEAVKLMIEFLFSNKSQLLALAKEKQRNTNSLEPSDNAIHGQSLSPESSSTGDSGSSRTSS